MCNKASGFRVRSSMSKWRNSVLVEKKSFVADQESNKAVIHEKALILKRLSIKIPGISWAAGQVIRQDWIFNAALVR